MTKHAYSPDTGELIRTETPAEWMELTDVAPPEFDPVTAGCFWRGDHWEIVPGEVPSDPVPKVVTMRQARLALLGAGLLAQVNTAVANMVGAEGDATRIEWEYAQEVRRDSPLVVALSAVFGWTAAQLDDLFTEGAKL